MTRTTGCHCPRTRRNWNDDGDCLTCNQRVLEVQIMDVVRAVMISDPRCLLWRNEIGHNTHFPDGTRRKGPIKYGLCNPGGADLIGLYAVGPTERDTVAADLLEQHGFVDVADRIRAKTSRFLAIETKTVRGRQSPDQVDFERYVTRRGGVYALIRSEVQARDLLERLQAEGMLA